MFSPGRIVSLIAQSAVILSLSGCPGPPGSEGADAAGREDDAAREIFEAALAELEAAEALAESSLAESTGRHRQCLARLDGLVEEHPTSFHGDGLERGALLVGGLSLPDYRQEVEARARAIEDAEKSYIGAALLLLDPAVTGKGPNRACHPAAIALAHRGDVPRAVELVEREPNAPARVETLHRIGHIVALAGRREEGTKLIAAHGGPGQRCRALTALAEARLEAEGRADAMAILGAALPFCEQVSGVGDRDRDLADVAAVFARAGEGDRARQIVSKTLSGIDGGLRLRGELAFDLAKRGQVDEALTLARGTKRILDRAGALTRVAEGMAEAGHDGVCRPAAEEAALAFGEATLGHDALDRCKAMASRLAALGCERPAVAVVEEATRGKSFQWTEEAAGAAAKASSPETAARLARALVARGKRRRDQHQVGLLIGAARCFGKAGRRDKGRAVLARLWARRSSVEYEDEADYVESDYSLVEAMVELGGSEDVERWISKLGARPADGDLRRRQALSLVEAGQGAAADELLPGNFDGETLFFAHIDMARAYLEVDDLPRARPHIEAVAAYERTKDLNLPLPRRREALELQAEAGDFVAVLERAAQMRSVVERTRAVTDMVGHLGASPSEPGPEELRALQKLARSLPGKRLPR